MCSNECVQVSGVLHGNPMMEDGVLVVREVEGGEREGGGRGEGRWRGREGVCACLTGMHRTRSPPLTKAAPKELLNAPESLRSTFIFLDGIYKQRQTAIIIITEKPAATYLVWCLQGYTQRQFQDRRQRQCYKH